jgi:hypothetical protein
MSKRSKKNMHGAKMSCLPIYAISFGHMAALRGAHGPPLETSQNTS